MARIIMRVRLCLTIPNYIMLWNYTDQGIRNVKDSPQRYESFKKDLEKAGAKSIGTYYTFGEYDGIVISKLQMVK